MPERLRTTAAGSLAVASSLLAVPLATGCKNPTQITLLLSSDQCGAPTETTIAVGPPGAVDGRSPVATTDSCIAGDVGSLVIVPSGADDELVGILVVMALEQGGDAGGTLATCTDGNYGSSCIVARRAVPYLPHQNLNLSVFLSGSCRGVACGPSTTCVDGQCVSATIADPAACAGDDGGCGEQALEQDGGLPGADAGVDAAVDTGKVDGTLPDSSSVDATLHDGATDTTGTMGDAPPDVPSCTAANHCYVVPPGWSLAGLDFNGAAPCPTGLSSSSSVISNTDGGTCTYSGCATTGPGSCAGPLTFGFSDFGGCRAGSVEFNPPGCSNYTDPFGLPIGQVSFTPTLVLACTTPTTTLPSYVASTQLCSAANACSDGPCTQSFGDLDPCIIAAGSQACPSGSVFSNAYTIADTAVPTCPTPACQATGNCGGTVVTFTEPDCKDGGTMIPATGACTAFGNPIASVSYAPAPPTETNCSNPAPQPASVTLGNPRTACCVQ